MKILKNRESSVDTDDGDYFILLSYCIIQFYLACEIFIGRFYLFFLCLMRCFIYEFLYG